MNPNKNWSIFLLLVCLSNFSYCCNNTTNNINKGITGDSILPTDTIDCLHIIANIVWKSGYSKENDNKKIDIHNTTVYIDTIKSGVITIRVTYQGPHDNREIPLSSLELDMNKDELRDVTIDPNGPVQLEFDKTLLPLIRKKCLQ